MGGPGSGRRPSGMAGARKTRDKLQLRKAKRAGGNIKNIKTQLRVQKWAKRQR